MLDDETNRLLEDMAANRAGNLRVVVREASQFYDRVKDRLLERESDAEFQKMMEGSAADIRAERVVPHAQVQKHAHSRKRSL